MTQLGFGFDPSRCTGCGACQIACEQSHDLPPGANWRRVEKLPPHAGQSDLRFLSWSCMHCAEPACLYACPARAYVKRVDDGIVLHLDYRCLGCRYCIWACPYGAPQFDRVAGIVTRCDFCVERLADGLEPACVETCFNEALVFGPMEELEARGFTATRANGLPDPDLTKPSFRVRPEK